MRRRSFKRLLLLSLLCLGLILIWSISGRLSEFGDPRSQDFLRWWRGNTDERNALVTAQREACPGAPFILPADGYIGLLYGDPRGPYSASSPHQGIDIFSNTDPGVTPVYAAYDGYLTREMDWKSTVIIRIPNDPLVPGSQIWLYYTHMADSAGSDFILDEFPPGTSEKFVQQGSLLGFTGDYNGNSLRNIWVHLHFSIVKDNGHGRYLNELQFENTLDPSPYLGMELNHACAPDTSGCSSNLYCS